MLGPATDGEQRKANSDLWPALLTNPAAYKNELSNSFPAG